MDRAGHLIGRDGTISETLFALGPRRAGIFWEATAVPDIRQLAGTVADTALRALDCRCVTVETV